MSYQATVVQPAFEPAFEGPYWDLICVVILTKLKLTHDIECFKKEGWRKNKIIIIICIEIHLFVRQENVAIFFRAWPIAMFQKTGLKKKEKMLINCNEIPYL